MAIEVPIQAAASIPDAATPPAEDAMTLDGFVEQFGKSPIVQQLRSGSPAAIYAPQSVFGENADQAIAMIEYAAPSLGLDLVQAPKSAVYVFFNPEKVKAEDILSADEAGTLDQIATAAEGMTEGGAAAPAAAESPVAPPQNVAGGLLPAGAEDDLMRARVGTLAPKPPTKQPLPSQGIVNGLLQRAT